jgi:hypothetical protein
MHELLVGFVYLVLAVLVLCVRGQRRLPSEASTALRYQSARTLPPVASTAGAV